MATASLIIGVALLGLGIVAFIVVYAAGKKELKWMAVLATVFGAITLCLLTPLLMCSEAFSPTNKKPAENGVEAPQQQTIVMPSDKILGFFFGISVDSARTLAAPIGAIKDYAMARGGKSKPGDRIRRLMLRGTIIKLPVKAKPPRRETYLAFVDDSLYSIGVLLGYKGDSKARGAYDDLKAVLQAKYGDGFGLLRNHSWVANGINISLKYDITPGDYCAYQTTLWYSFGLLADKAEDVQREAAKKQAESGGF